MCGVEQGRVLEVPKHLRSTSYKGASDLGHEGYQYAHNHEDHFVDQEYIPTSTVYYSPTDQGYEDVIAKRMAAWEALRKEPRESAD